MKVSYWIAKLIFPGLVSAYDKAVKERAMWWNDNVRLCNENDAERLARKLDASRAEAQVVVLKIQNKARGEKVARFVGEAKNLRGDLLASREARAKELKLYRDENLGLRGDVKVAEEAYDILRAKAAADYGMWHQKCHELEMDIAGYREIFEKPGNFQEMLESGEPKVDWSHWGVKVLAHSFKQTLQKAGAPNSVAFEIGEVGTPLNFHVTISRVGKTSVREALEKRIEAIKALLDIIDKHVSVRDENRSMFNLVFNVDERITIKRAFQLIEDSQTCTSNAQTTSESGGQEANAA